MRSTGPRCSFSVRCSGLPSPKGLSTGLWLSASGRFDFNTAPETILTHRHRYGCKLLSDGDVSMYDFFVAFMGVFYAGQATAIIFMFSSSMQARGYTMPSP